MEYKDAAIQVIKYQSRLTACNIKLFLLFNAHEIAYPPHRDGFNPRRPTICCRPRGNEGMAKEVKRTPSHPIEVCGVIGYGRRSFDLLGSAARQLFSIIDVITIPSTLSETSTFQLSILPFLALDLRHCSQHASNHYPEIL